MDADGEYCPEPCEFIYKNIVFDDVTTPEIIQRCENFEFRENDIVICTFPRNGTTLTQEIVWEIVNHETIEKDVKFESLIVRFPFLELNPSHRKLDIESPIDILEGQSKDSPRLIKTHLPYFLLRRQLEKVKPKVIIVMRNPKDTAVALYHFYQALRGSQWLCTWPDFLQRFINGKTIYGDYFVNCLEWWGLRDQENVLILHYEDILHHKHQQVRTIAQFLGYQVPKDKVDVIVHNTAFKTMSKNPNVNTVIGDKNQTFLRKGVTGNWQDTFTVAQNEIMDEIIKRKLGGSGLNFQYS